MNKSYRRYAVGRTTSDMAYVRQTLVNSYPGVFFTESIWSASVLPSMLKDDAGEHIGRDLKNCLLATILLSVGKSENRGECVLIN